LQYNNSNINTQPIIKLGGFDSSYNYDHVAPGGHGTHIRTGNVGWLVWGMFTL